MNKVNDVNPGLSGENEDVGIYCRCFCQLFKLFEKHLLMFLSEFLGTITCFIFCNIRVMQLQVLDGRDGTINRE